MENIKNKAGKGPQASFLKGEEFYMSPALFGHMKSVKKTIEEQQNLTDGPSDYESSFKLMQVSHDKIKSDVWSLGATILYAGNLKTIQSIYDKNEYEINMEALNKQLAEFEGRYKEKSPELVECVKKMLTVPESGRPTFDELKKKYAAAIRIKPKSQKDAFQYGVIQDPFKNKALAQQKQQEIQATLLTQKQQQEYNLYRMSEHPVHGGEFGKHLEVGKKKYGHFGVNHGTLTLKQAKILDSMEFVQPRNRQYVTYNFDFQDNLNSQQVYEQSKNQKSNLFVEKMNDTNVINRRYFN